LPLWVSGTLAATADLIKTIVWKRDWSRNIEKLIG